MTARLKSDAFAAVSRFLFLLMNLSWDLSKKKERKGPVPDTRGSEMLNVSFFVFNVKC